MSNPADTIQRAWLDVQCSTLGSEQYVRKMTAFLDKFNRQLTSRKDPQFKRWFSNGNELVTCVCKCFVASAKNVLAVADGEERGTVDASRTLHIQLLRALIILTDYDAFPGKDVAELTSTFERVEENNTMSLLLMLHENQLNAALTASSNGDSEALLAKSYLALAARLLGCPQKGFIKRSVAVATQRSYVKLMATTLVKCSACAAAQSPSGCPAAALAGISEAAAKVFERQVHYAPNFDTVEEALGIVESGLNSSQPPLGSRSGGAELAAGPCGSPLPRLACYTYLMESVVSVRARFGFAETEMVSLSITTAQVLSSEIVSSASSGGPAPADVEPREKLCARLVKCLEIFATAERRPGRSSPMGTPDRKYQGVGESLGASGLFQLVPDTFSKLQHRLVSTLGGGDSERRGTLTAAPVKCVDAVVSMVAIVVRSKVPETAETFGQTLFRILRYRNTPFDLISVTFHVCMDNARTLGAVRLTVLLEFLSDIGDAYDLTPLVEVVIRKIREDAFPEGECKMLVLDFLLLFATKSPANAAVVLEEGLFAACLVTLSSMLVEKDPSAKMLADKVAVLSKVVVQSPKAAQALEGQNVPRLLLDAIVLACRLNVPSVSVMLRDMFTNFVVKTGSFYNTLIVAIANCSEPTPWRPESGSLLATLVATMQGGKFVEEAIEQNAIELCLSMVHHIAASSTPAADLQLLGSCLGLLLPRVCYSDVWSLYDSSIRPMTRTLSHAQFIVDLCCGVYSSAECCAACQRYFEGAGEGAFLAVRENGSTWLTRVGPFFVPQRPFMQLQYPLKTLMEWCEIPASTAIAAGESLGGMHPAADPPADPVALRRVVEHLILTSEVKLPNTYVSPSVLNSKDLQLLCCLRDVTDRQYLPYFFGSDTSLAAVMERQSAWLAVLCRPKKPFASSSSTGATIDHCFNAHFADTGGASGVVSCVGEQWPSADGYAVAMWVHWENASPAQPSDRKNVLWQLSRPSQQGGVNGFTISLTVTPKQQRVHYSCQDGMETKTIELPFVPENTWVHVTVCHHRGKLFGSQLKVYYDGVLVQASNCPYPSSAFQVAVAAATAGVLPPMGGGRGVTCVVGGPREKPNGAFSLRFISLHVYNSALPPEDVVALYCNGARCHGQGNWDAPGEPSIYSLLSPFLSDEVLRSLAVARASNCIHAVCERESIVLRAVPQRCLLRLDARSMSLVEAPIGHVGSAKRWALYNCTPSPCSEFSVYGSFIPPQNGMSNEVDALLSHGAVREWVCWLDAIAAAASAARQGLQPTPMTTTATTLSLCEGVGELGGPQPAEVAQRFLRILAAANKQTHLSPSTWRRLLGRLIEEAIRRPEVYLRDETSLRSLLSLSVRGMACQHTVTVPTATATTTLQSASESNLTCPADGLLYFTSLMEHIFFNWKVLAKLPLPAFFTVLSVMERLLGRENVFRDVNALRFRAADFVNGFICGMFREFVEPHALARAMRCVELMLHSQWRRADFLSEILTLCASSTSLEASNVGGRLATVCPQYTTRVRNLLLRAVHNVWDGLPGEERDLFARTLSSVLSGAWLTAMSARSMHPGTVVLALRLFVICFTHSDSFRDTYRGERALFLAEALASHAHQRDVLDVVLYAALGLVWSLGDVRSGASAPGPCLLRGRRAYDRLPALPEGGALSLLELVLHLVKRLAHILMMRSEELSAACAVDGPLLNVLTYFEVLDKAAARPPRPTPRLRSYVLLVLCAVRLRRRLSEGPAAITSPAPPGSLSPRKRSAGVLDEVPAGSAAARAAVMDTVREVLGWLAQHYHGSRSLQKALYRSDELVNAMDLLAWPLLSTFDVRCVEVDAVRPVGARHAEVSTELPVSAPGSPKGRSRSFKGRVEPCEDGGWVDIARDEDDDAEEDEEDEEDWEMLPAVISTDSRSYGLDHLRPRAGFEGLYDACTSFYVTHALERITDGDEFILPRGRIRMSKFVLALHRALAAEPRGVGNQLENCRAAFLCSAWMKAAEQSIDAASSASSSPPGIKNVLSLGDYLLSRLVSAAAIPPLGLSSFFRFVLTRLDRNTEVVRRSRTWLFEWLMYVLNGAYHKCDGSRAAAVVDMLAANSEVLFAAPMPAGDLLRVVTVRLLELTHACLSVVENTSSGDTERLSAALLRLANIWLVFINANREAGALLAILRAPGKPDLWVDGFDTLLQFPSTKGTQDFVVWLQANKPALWRCYQGVAQAPFTYTVAEGGKNAKLIRKTVHMHQQSASQAVKHATEACRRNEMLWASFLDTATFVDPAIVEHGRYTFPSSCVIMATSGDAPGFANEQRWWFLHQNGAVGVKELYAHEKVDDLASEPISLYIRYPPPICLPVRLSKSETVSPYCSLRWNALSVLSKITGQSAVRWVGNAYYVVGNDSHICTVTVTAKEVVLISCSEFTKDGDFFIAQIRPQTARQKSGIKTSFMQNAWRRLLTTAGGVTGGSQSSGTATTSKAAFRHSQYYRQLRTEALVNADALVWRFPLGHIASIHQRLFQHMPAGLEFVLETGERFLVVVLDEELSFSRAARDKLQDAVAELASFVDVETMTSKRAKLASTTRRWVSGEVSNYDYLLALNDAASRSIADIGQYPVMPWVLKDYRSDSIDLATGAIFRDLSKPVGALNAAKAEQLQRRYREWVSETEPPFHYGTHYSSGAIVLYYLLRLQPFTARAISYQGGRLDIADRLFHSISEAWDNSSGSGTGDVKELIPEFFSLGAFLQNRNHTALGIRRDGSCVGDVVLPPWSQQQPTLFTHVNALALESVQVTESLHEWIDLIFGYRQTGEAALAAVNVFHSLSYQEGVQLAINNASSEEDRKAIVASADNFGQTPIQLFTRVPHPPRNTSIPSRQHTLITGVKSIYSAEVLPEGRVVTATRGTPFARLYEVDQVIYGCPSNHVMSLREPTEVFVYDGRTDAISSTLARHSRPNATLPPVASIGCGEFSCMCVSAMGNLLCVGTSTGKIILFTRASPSDAYAITTILHSSDNTDDGVLMVKLQMEGNLVASHAESATVTGWHVSALGSMFSFRLEIPPCDGDCSVVSCVSLDEQRGVYYGARERSVVLFSKHGVLLRQMSISPFLEALLVKLGRASDSSYDISEIRFCVCSSYSEENIFALGHRNGLITLWGSQAVTYSDTQTVPNYYDFRYLHVLSCAAAVTSLLFLRSGSIIVAGLDNGTIAQFCYPSTIDDDPLLFTQ